MYLLRLSCLLLVSCLFSVAHGVDRPNVIFIYTDDQAPTALGLTSGSQFQTPHIDRIFREGAQLSNGFTTTPVCSPSRASLMTSRYASELGIDDWISPTREAKHGLDPAYETWPELFAAAGYRCGLIGKWHLGTADRYHPTEFGYGHFMGFRGGGNKPKNPRLEKDGKQQQFTGLTPDILTSEAIAFIERKDPAPFLLSLHFRAPHAAWLPVADEDWLPFKDLEPRIPNPEIPGLLVDKIRRQTREYMASVASVDRNVGRLLQALDRLQLTQDTVVIFTSDHGYHLGHHGLWYKGNAQWQLRELPAQRWPGIPRKQRPNLFDQALRVPAAVRWPTKIRAGTVVKETVTNLDWYPTLLAMAGIEQPDVTLRGHNFLPLLQGTEVPWDNDMYAEYNMKHGATTKMRAYRTPEWKLMVDFHNTGREELYDLRNDPAEAHNLIASQDAEVIKIKQALRAKIREKMQRLQDPIVAEAKE